MLNPYEKRLDDTERKTLRVLSSMKLKRKRPPSIAELAFKTGRPEWKIVRALRGLNEKGFIAWEHGRHDELRIIREWEDYPKRRSQPAIWYD